MRTCIPGLWICPFWNRSWPSVGTARTGEDLTAMVALFKEMDAVQRIYTTRCLLQLRFYQFYKEDYAAFVVAQTAEANAKVVNALLLPGVTIGEEGGGGCSVVNKDVPAGMMVAGSPARVVRERRSRGKKAWNWITSGCMKLRFRSTHESKRGRFSRSPGPAHIFHGICNHYHNR